MRRARFDAFSLYQRFLTRSRWLRQRALSLIIFFVRARKRRHNQHRTGGMSHRAFSDAANQRTPQTRSAVRRDDDQVCSFL